MRVKSTLFAAIMDHRIIISALLMAITIFLGWFAVQVEFDNTIETYFLEKDLKDYRKFLDQFGTDEIIAIAFGGENIFTIDNLHLIDSISRKLETLPHVRRVISLTTADIVHGEAGMVDFSPLVPDLPTADSELAHIRHKALSDPFIPGTLISPDSMYTAIVVEIDHIIGAFDYKIDLIKKIRAIVKDAEKRSGKHFYLGGGSILDDALFRYTQKDQARYFPIMALIVIVTMFVMFRSLAWAALPLIVVILSAVWTYGLLVLFGFKVNIISTIIGPFLMAVAIADSMHVIGDYLQESASGNATRSECIQRTFNHLLAPCFMTSLTTILGLLSLLSANLTPIREFGLVATCGVASAFIITICLLPILFSILPSPRPKHRTRIQKGLMPALLQWLGRWGKGKAAVAIILGLIALIVAVFLWPRLVVGTSSLDYFKKDDIVRTRIEWIDAHVGGTTSLEFFVDTGREDGLKSPALLKKMDRFQDYLKQIDGITGVYSVVDMVKYLNREFHDGDRNAYTIPSSSDLISQELLIVEGSDDLETLLTSDGETGRITARVTMAKSRELASQMPAIRKTIAAIFGTAATVTPTGIVHLLSRMETYLLSSQVKSFILAFTVITIVIMIMLRSIKLGALAMIPNILPIMLTLGLMPVLRIPLDVGTAMIAGVAMGLIVDDTIHFLYRLKKEMTRTDHVKSAIAESITATGRPIIFTSVVLSLGFFVLVFASFKPVINFGILSVVVIVLALIFDLIVLPAVMIVTHR